MNSLQSGYGWDVYVGGGYCAELRHPSWALLYRALSMSAGHLDRIKSLLSNSYHLSWWLRSQEHW